ncbi:branched-chain amino acid ABC transporter ATP-binding protein/permease [soil metagenome]
MTTSNSRSSIASPMRRRVGAVVLVLVVWAATSLSGALGDYGKVLVAAIAFNAIAVLAISTLAGVSGIWSLGHTSFIALGAYLAANLAGMNWPIELIVPVAAITAGIAGYVIGLSAGRFSILYFGLLTLAVALTSMEIIGRLLTWTGGDQGMPMPPVRSLLAGRALGSPDATGVALVLALVAFLAADFVIKGARGRRWRAVKSHRLASMSLGLVPHRENALAFALSAAISSAAGVAAALAIGYLEPESFNLDAGVLLIVATVVGGIGSFAGAIVGSAFIVAIPELSRGLRDVSAFGMGFAMVAVLLFLPRGLVPSILGLFGSSASRRASKPVFDEAEHVVDDTVAARITALARELMPASDRALVVKDLNVTFGGLKALQGVSLDVPAGRTVGLIGPNGAGKTTLLNVLSGYVTPSSCRTVSLGADTFVGVAPYRRLGLGFGRTFQHAELFNELTIREMLMVAATVGRRQTASKTSSTLDPSALTERIIEGLGLERVADRFPDELPFGIQKVADIGRILATGPSLVALDEPFSGLDHTETRELRAILQGMKAAGVSILIIDHAVQEVLDIADQVVVFDFGKVIATGSPAEIEGNADVQRAYFGSVTTREVPEVDHV